MSSRIIKGRKIVIVTGGSRGIGLEIARKLAASEYAVMVLAREKRKPLIRAIAEAKSRKSGSIGFIPCDLADIEDIPRIVRELRKDFGPIYGLVNNAALAVGGALAIMHNSQIEKLVRLNVLSPVILSKYVVRSMMAAGTGRIVNVASIIGFTGYSGLSVYGATKSALIGFTRSLAREVGRFGICVNAVAPGFVDTDMTQELVGAQRQQVIRRSALRRLVGASDVANAVDYLLGSDGRNISGTVLTVDAGATA